MAEGKQEFPEPTGRTHFVFEFLFCRLRYRIAIIGVGILAAMFGLAAPYFQKLFIDKLVISKELDFSSGELIKLIGITFLASLAAQLFLTASRILCVRESVIAQRWVSQKLYNHTLRLSSRARATRTVGETVSIYAQDVAAMASLLDELMPNFVSSAIPLAVAPLAVSFFYSIPFWPVLLTTTVCIGLCLLLGILQSGFFGKVKHDADMRISVVNEWLQNIRVIRVLGWTATFEQKIFACRRKETSDRLRMVTNGSSMNSIAQVTPLLLNVVGVLTLIQMTHSHVTPGEIFSLLWVFGVFLARPVRMLPWALIVALDALTSNKRLHSFFNSEAEPVLLLKNPVVLAQPAAIEVQDLNLTIAGRLLLSGIDFKILPGEFVAIVGEVGSGKSLLLQSLLRETEATCAYYFLGTSNASIASLEDVRASFSYVPQDGFVMSASLRDNVNFVYDSALENDAAVLEDLELAAFHLESENVSYGLSTEIGERGVNLSGGQRQRVSLARALRHDRPIVLLDDCLSALDVETERQITQQLLLGRWKNKTRILVTHRLSVLAHCDRVFEMAEGRLTERKKALELQNEGTEK